MGDIEDYIDDELLEKIADEDEKTKQTGVVEKTKFFTVGPFNVVLYIDNLRVYNWKSDCDCTSEVEEMTSLLLFREPNESDFTEKHLNICEHEYAAMCHFYTQQYIRIKEKYDVEEL